MVNLGIIEPGGYFIDGSYGISEMGTPMPLQARLKIDLMPNVLEIDGTWQQHSGRPTHAFKLQIIRDHTSQSQADVTATGTFIGTLKGRASLSRPAYEILASDPAKEQLMSVHLMPSEKFGVFEISGFVSLGTHHYPFHGHVVPTEGRAALSNVVSLAGKVA